MYVFIDEKHRYMFVHCIEYIAGFVIIVVVVVIIMRADVTSFGLFEIVVDRLLTILIYIWESDIYHNLTGMSTTQEVDWVSRGYHARCKT